MRGQEDFRTPAGGANAARAGAPIFDEQSALKAAPVVPLEKVARRERFTRLAGNLRGSVNTPQFRRSWPLALLLVATLLAAAVAATNIYTHDDDTARNVAPAATADNGTDRSAAEDAEQAAAAPATSEIDNPREARGARRAAENVAAPDPASTGNEEAIAASALGSFAGGDVAEQGGASASARDGERDKGKRQKRSKRREGARRNGGGAVLFDVIR